MTDFRVPPSGLEPLWGFGLFPACIPTRFVLQYTCCPSLGGTGLLAMKSLIVTRQTMRGKLHFHNDFYMNYPSQKLMFKLFRLF